MKPYILGHRGAPKLAIENSLTAFKKAVDIGVDGVELDIHMTFDNEIVVIHDETIESITNGQGYIKEMKFSELRKYNLVSNFFDKAKIPTLKEVLLKLKKCEIINIEIKNSVIKYPGIEKKAIELVKSLKLEENVIFSSFNHYSIKKIQEIAPQIKTGILYDSNIFEPWNYAKKLTTKNIHPHFFTINKKIVDQSHKNGLKVFVYGANTKKEIKTSLNIGVDAIITDFPKKAMKLRDR